jgi:hypothetical protein
MHAQKLGYVVAAVMTAAAMMACGNSDTDGSGNAGAAGAAAGGSNGLGGSNLGGTSNAGNGQGGTAPADSTVIAAGLNEPRALAVDATSAYVVTTPNNGDGSIQKVPLAGGAPTTIGPAVKQVRGFAVDATSIYWIDGDKVMKMGLGGENPATLFTITGGSLNDGLVIHGDSVYVSSLSATGGILEIPKAGGDPKVIVQGFTQGLEGGDDSGLYWDGFDASAPTTKSIVHGGYDGSSPVTLTSYNLTTDGQVYGFYADGTSAYYIFRPMGQNVNQGFKVASTGGTPTKLFEVHDDAEEILVAGASIVINDIQAAGVGIYTVDASGKSTRFYGEPSGGSSKHIRYANGTIYWTGGTSVDGQNAVKGKAFP